MATDFNDNISMNPSDWLQFFPPNEKVIATPFWERPRLLFSIKNIDKLEIFIDKLFYLNTLKSRIYKQGIIIWTKINKKFLVRKNEFNICVTDLLVEDLGLYVDNMFIIVGKPAPIQKIKVVLLDKMGDVVGYIKFSYLKLAQKRLKQEYEILSSLPEGIAPRPWKLQKVLEGTALLISPIHGILLEVCLPPPEDVLAFQKKLVIDREVKLENHPWIEKLSEKGFTRWEWLEPLQKKKWDIVIEHGDFAPWNLLRDSTGKIWAIDWEFADLCGFPYVDIIYYFLQISALIYKWSPAKAFKIASEYLQSKFAFNKEIANSLVKLSAFEAYWITSQNGRSDNWPLQKWRRKIWEIEN